MDQILQKHLVEKLMIHKPDPIKAAMSPMDFITYQSCKVLDESYHIKTEDYTIVTKVLGYWKDKPIILHNSHKYVLLENSKSLVNLDNFGDKKIVPASAKTTRFTQKNSTVQAKAEKASKIKEEPKIKVSDEPVSVVETKPIYKTVSNLPETKPTQNYISGLKSQDEKTPEIKTSEDAEEAFFDILETKKDDPRIKKFFNYHADQAKKELFSITEKFTQQQMARAMESGGGTNAVQYANGGTMRGDLIVDGNLTVTGTSNTGGGTSSNKKVFTVGDGVHNEYTLIHSLNTKDIIVSVYDSNYESVLASIKNISLNETLISFSNIIAVDSIKVVIMG